MAVIEQVNNLVEAHELAALAGDPVSLAPLVAVLLDPPAAELLVTWRAEARIQSPEAAFTSGYSPGWVRGPPAGPAAAGG